MSLDENGALERTTRGPVSRQSVIIAVNVFGGFLFLDTNEHLRKQIALQLLPGFAVLPNTYLAT